MQYKLKNLFLIFFLFSTNISCIKIDRIILATDNNPDYIEFWPVVAKAWKELLDVKPTLALIDDKSIKIDESCGDVIRFGPIAGIPTSLQAQTIRLLLPAYFENEVCLISDIDMIPVNKKFFSENIKNIPDDFYILFFLDLYDKPGSNRFPMCYNLAKGKIFKEIFYIDKLEDIPHIIKFWYQQGFGFITDEIVLYKYLSKWKNLKTKFTKIDYKYDQRVDRQQWNFYKSILRILTKTKKDYFIDIHCPRPYSKNKNDIDMILNLFK